MHLVVVGVNHKTAPLALREKVAFDEGRLGESLAALVNKRRVEEVCIVSTCNRTEIYAVTPTRADDEALLSFLARYGGVDADTLAGCTYRQVGHHAAKHLFEVACGLDSMALGETQILGQIRNAYCVAEHHKGTGKILNTLFQQAIAVGKRARTETGISCGAFSIGAAAAQLAKLVFVSLEGRGALLLGAGEMSKLAATHLQSQGVDRIYIANRTRANAEPLATSLGAEVIEFDRFPEVLAKVDLVISSTAAPSPIITRDIVEAAMRKRKHAPLFLIDIAVPRDIDPVVSQINGVFVYNIDDLQYLVDRCRHEREAEVAKVEAIVDEETSAFMEYLRQLEAVPMIKQLRRKFDGVYESEWNKCAKKLSHLSPEDLECVRRSIRSAVKKLSHDPILRMKDFASNGGKEKLDVARELFGLSPEDDEPA